MKPDKIIYIGGTEEQYFDEMFENTWPTPPEVEAPLESEGDVANDI